MSINSSYSSHLRYIRNLKSSRSGLQLSHVMNDSTIFLKYPIMSFSCSNILIPAIKKKKKKGVLSYKQQLVTGFSFYLSYRSIIVCLNNPCSLLGQERLILMSKCYVSAHSTLLAFITKTVCSSLAPFKMWNWITWIMENLITWMCFKKLLPLLRHYCHLHIDSVYLHPFIEVLPLPSSGTSLNKSWDCLPSSSISSGCHKSEATTTNSYF